MHLTTFIETQFKGRMMLMPPFAYTQSMDLTEQWLQHCHSDLSAASFKHVFFLTTDAAWTSIKIDGEVIWCHRFRLKAWTHN